ncbi:hypothetical protein [Photobacterium leiognathi]|uniref:hypothetical protein n=1 Tax=Photobacterium leiognathi TaxID=553611 RepID=UPI002980E7E5|nr:hypothetical protein [Photobacterium leiognathi]
MTTNLRIINHVGDQPCGMDKINRIRERAHDLYSVNNRDAILKPLIVSDDDLKELYAFELCDSNGNVLSAMTCEQLPLRKDLAIVTWAYTETKNRNQGYCNKLLDHAVTYFSRLNIKLVLVECKSIDCDSQQFWAQKGFVNGIATEDPTVVYLCSNIEAL